MITKEQALKQFREATTELDRRNNREVRLTKDQKAILEEDRIAARELIQAREALEKAIGTSCEGSAVERLQKAEALAPVRSRLAEPVKALAYRLEADSKGERDKFHQREARKALAWFYSCEIVQKLDLAGILPNLQLAYSVYVTNADNPPEWGEWLAKQFPAPKKWDSMAINAKRGLDEYLAHEITKEVVANEVNL